MPGVSEDLAFLQLIWAAVKWVLKLAHVFSVASSSFDFSMASAVAEDGFSYADKLWVGFRGAMSFR